MKRDGVNVQPHATRFAKKLVPLAKKAVAGEPAPAVQKGEGGYADWVIIAINGLREYLDRPLRYTLDLLRTMYPVCAELGLRPDELPHFTTVCVRVGDLEMPAWRNLLELAADLHEIGEIQAIDATGMDRIAASHHYAKRTGYTFKAAKTTILIDCETGAILDIHCVMKKAGDSKIGWQVLTRNIEKLSKLTADKGYDDEILRLRLRAEGVKPLIKHREFTIMDRANNSLIDDKKYNHRLMVESVFHALKRRYGDFLRSRTWFGQFRELVLKAAVRNVELTLEGP